MKHDGTHNTLPRKRRRTSGLSLSESLATALLYCLAAAFLAQADMVTLQPLGDNWISSCSTGCTVNNGSMDELRVRTAWWGSPGNREPKNFRSLLSFDLAPLPEDANLITDATLGLYYFNTPHNDPAGRTYDVHCLTNAWEEMESTWQAHDDYNTPDPLFWDSYNNGVPVYQPGGGDFASTVYASATVPASVGQWMTWDVTALVKEWAGEQYDNFGLLVKDAAEIESDPGGDTISYLARFRSSECTDSEFRPYLEVTFVPEPSAIALTGLGLAVFLWRRSDPTAQGDLQLRPRAPELARGGGLHGH